MVDAQLVAIIHTIVATVFVIFGVFCNVYPVNER